LKHLALFISVFLLHTGFAQNGGRAAFRFLDVPMTARAAALGGSSMSIWGEDINLIYSNPSLLNPSMDKQLSLNYSNYVSDLNFWYLGYGHDLKKYGTAALSVQAFNYGKFQGYDEMGSKTGTFKAADYSINMTYAKPLADSTFNIGIALKTIVSQYDAYTSLGNAIDFGITWRAKGGTTASLLARNVGRVWKTYTPNNPQDESLPTSVQFGMSKKVPKAPFRLFFVYDQLLKWNLRYISPVDTTGNSSSLASFDTPVDSSSWQKFGRRFGVTADNFFRHLTLGTEILITKSFNLRVSYNYRRQREMTIPERRGINALSLGFGFRVKRFGVAYSFSKMAFAGNSSVFSLTFGW
jgi:hypothetical protein